MIFDAAFANDVARLERFINKFGNDVNERNEDGLTCLHICAAKGHFESVCCLLELGAQFSLQDFENGWTALHFSVYYNHPRISLILIQYGAVLDVEFSHPKDGIVDKTGLSPLQLLSTVLTSNQKLGNNPIQQFHGSIVSSGKSDIVLGVPLPKAVNILRPKRLDSLLNENIVAISSAKYHNLAICAEGRLWSWGHGKSGKLGHGDESSQPEPRIVHLPSPRIRITHVAAAEGHSLALSENGDVFSWGSDRFGQLGLGSLATAGTNNNQVNTSSHRSTGGSLETHRIYTRPTRIDSLRKDIVVGIAAGEAHSLCFTSNNELFAWGSNKHGQLGLRFTDTSAGNAGQQVNTPKKVKFSLSSTVASVGSSNFGSLNGSGGRVMTIVQVIAGQSSSLLLTRSLASNSSINQDRHHGIRIGIDSEVYQWGDGVFQPRKIHFPRTQSQGRSRENSIIQDESYNSSFEALTVDHSQINMICAGKNHFLALSKAGSVYSWGLGADQLGHGTQATSHLSVPMVIEALHPDRTKSGKVVFIAAAGNRSAAVTTLGEVFLWGTSTSSINSNYRPIPQRESGIRRATKVSLTEDSTFVLANATMPLFPVLYHDNERTVATRSLNKKKIDHYHDENSDDDENNEESEEEEFCDEKQVQSRSRSDGEVLVPSLQAICQVQLCKSVNMKNVIDALLFSEQHCSFLLERYCLDFMSLNLDALLVQLKPKNLDRIAMEWCLPVSRNRKPSWEHNAASVSLFSKGNATRSANLKSPTAAASTASNITQGRRQQNSSGSQKDTSPSTATAMNSQSRKNCEVLYLLFFDFACHVLMARFCLF